MTPYNLMTIGALFHLWEMTYFPGSTFYNNTAIIDLSSVITLLILLTLPFFCAAIIIFFTPDY